MSEFNLVFELGDLYEKMVQSELNLISIWKKHVTNFMNDLIHEIQEVDNNNYSNRHSVVPVFTWLPRNHR